MAKSTWQLQSLAEFKEQNPLKNFSSRVQSDTDEYAKYVNLSPEAEMEQVGGWEANPIVTRPG
jgi:hypothetical protein